MNIESIKDLMDNFDPATLLPDLGSVTGKVELVTRICVMAGPIVLLVLGILYLFAAPKEANYSFGYRCYFGMGSVQAWRFTQRLSGVVLGGLGLILTVAMLIVCGSFRGLTVMDMVSRAVTALIWQVIPTLLGCLGVNITAMVLFNAKGDPRRKEKNEQ